jgi:hypothetical protein
MLYSEVMGRQYMYGTHTGTSALTVRIVTAGLQIFNTDSTVCVCMYYMKCTI